MVTSLSATLLITVTAVFTSRTLLLALTMAPLPIAVALVRFPADTSGLEPDSGVEAAHGVVTERRNPAGGVGDARAVAKERVCPQTGVGLRRRNPRL